MMLSRILPAFLLFALATAAMAAPVPKPEEFLSRDQDAEFFTAFQSQVIGEAPAPAEPEWKIESSEQLDGYTRQKISYNVEAAERISAWLLIPDHAAGTKLPLVFCLHPTSGNGKDMVLNLNQHPKNAAEVEKFANRAYALELVKRGFVCFAPDRAGFGERGPDPNEKDAVKNMRNYQKIFEESHPGWHWIFGKVPYDLSRALDFLATFDYIDAENVGSIGHSLGGWDTIYFYGSDPRVKAAVTNSGGAHNFVSQFWLDQKARLAFAAKKLQVTPNTDTSAQVFIMMGAPRPLLYIRGIKEAGTDYPASFMENVKFTFHYFKSFSPNSYERNGKPQFAAFFHSDGHDFPAYARELAYAWLEQQLKPTSK